MLWVCVACVIILICGVVFFYAKISAILDHLDEMIDQAIEGTLTENEFSEKKASRIEAKLYRFLRAGKMDRQQAVKERDSIKSLISDISHQTKTSCFIPRYWMKGGFWGKRKKSFFPVSLPRQKSWIS